MTGPSIHVRNLLRDLPDDLSTEQLETLLQVDGARLERIVSHGQSSPPGFWYDQPEAEWVCVLAGAARLTIQYETGPETVSLAAGDALLIPARQKHRVDWTTAEQPTVWLALHLASNSST